MFGTPIVAFALADPARRRHGVRPRDQRRRARARLRRHGHVSVSHAARQPARARRGAARARRGVRDGRRAARARRALDVGRVGAAGRGARVARVPPAAQARAARGPRAASAVGHRVRGIRSGRAAVLRGRLADRERLLPRRASARARGASSRRGCSIPSASRESFIRRCRTGSPSSLSIALLAWGGGWWLFGGFTEVVRSVASDAQFAALLGFASATALLAMLAAQRACVAAAQLALADAVADRRVLRRPSRFLRSHTPPESSVGSRGRSSPARCSGSCARAKRGSRASRARCT